MSLGQDREPMLAAAFVELADTLVADFDVVEFLHGLADRCVALLEVDAAGLMLADQRGSLRVVASSSEQARLVELFQLQHDQGRAWSASRRGAGGRAGAGRGDRAVAIVRARRSGSRVRVGAGAADAAAR